jgi:prevent-host-death family protein
MRRDYHAWPELKYDQLGHIEDRVMEIVQVAQAKAQLSALLERVEAGEEIVIARRGKSIARLVPERANPQSAAEVLSAAWALGGFELEEIRELPIDRHRIDLD